MDIIYFNNLKKNLRIVYLLKKIIKLINVMIYVENMDFKVFL